MEKEIVINGKKVIYFEEGQGFPFLIIHGWGPLTPFLKFRELLVSRGYRVILLNLPGFGRSSFPARGWGMDDYLDCILDFIDQKKLENFFLVGHSMGGAMSVKFAVSHPERIKALFLLAPGVFRYTGGNVWLSRVTTIGLFCHLAVVVIIKSVLSFVSAAIKKIGLERAFKKINGWLNNLKPHYQFFFQKERLMSNILERIVKTENTIPYLSKIERPVLIIWGGNDLFLLWLCGRFMNRIPDYDFRIVPDAGHSLHEEAPEKIVEIIAEFTKKIDDKEAKVAGKKKAQKRKRSKKAKALGPTFEKGRPQGEDEGKWRQKLETRAEKLKYLKTAEGYGERYGSEQRKTPA